MTFTYTADPQNVQLDAMRLLIGDTDSTAPLLQDSECNYFLSLNSNTFLAASESCKAISAKFARLADTTVDSVSIKHSQKAKQYAELGENLERKVKIMGALPFAGGISRQEIANNWNDNDLVKPSFSLGQDDHPSTSLDRNSNVI